MTEHVHEWALRIASDGRVYAECIAWTECMAKLTIFEAEARLNATERLSALITDLVANASDGVNEMGGPFVALSVIANILEGKDG